MSTHTPLVAVCILLSITHSYAIVCPNGECLPSGLRQLTGGGNLGEKCFFGTCNSLKLKCQNKKCVPDEPGGGTTASIPDKKCPKSRSGSQPCKRLGCENGLFASSSSTLAKSACNCECCNGQTPKCTSSVSLLGGFLTYGCECQGSTTASSPTYSATTKPPRTRPPATLRSDTSSEKTTPADTSTTPTDTPKTPTDTPKTPTDTPKTPTDTPKTPTDTSTTPTDTSTTPADCVETEWLQRNGLVQGELSRRKQSRVLCIRGLPCGTEGHILRSCNSSGVCKLVTYAEACDSNEVCHTAFKPVSRLRHSFDWSAVSKETAGSTLTLTSLSVHPGAGNFSPSYVLAFVADFLNDRGYGSICDGIVLAIIRIEDEVKGSLRKRFVGFGNCGASF